MRLFRGERLKVARQIEGLSQSELAKKLGISQSSLSKIEDAINDFPSEKFFLLEKTLGYKIGFYYKELIQVNQIFILK